MDKSFITERAVYLAFSSFGPKRTGGPDSFQPKVLQLFVENKVALKRLTELYKAIMTIGYSPKRWCISKVIFLQKPGKSDYSDPKSYRPISLMTFLLKGLERLVFWEINNTALKDKPLSKQQHAFRKGYSCQTAISDLVDNIESNILRNKLYMSTFLDIAGAFDNCRYPSIISAMEKRGINQKIIKWYDQFLNSRIAYTELEGVSSAVRVRKGCPQGGILSPLAWNLVFESFIDLFKDSAAQIGCYADDARIGLPGVCETSMAQIMQKELKKAFLWGETHGLEFVPSKTQIIFFHRKKTFKEPKQLKMKGISIPYQSEVKYLGVTLDSRLKWSNHLTQKINKSKRAIMRIRDSMGKMWGTAPKLLKWAYEGIIIPALSYGSAVWSTSSWRD